MESIIVAVWLSLGAVVFALLLRDIEALMERDPEFARRHDADLLATLRGRITLFGICELLWPIVAGCVVIAKAARALCAAHVWWLHWRMCVAARRLNAAICRVESASCTDVDRRSLDTAMQALRDAGFTVTVADVDDAVTSDTDKK